MYEIKRIGSFDIVYNGDVFPQYLFINTYNNRVYQSPNKDDVTGSPTNMFLDKIPEPFEDVAVLIDSCEITLDNGDARHELVLKIPSIDKEIIATYHKDHNYFGQIYYSYTMQFENK